MLCVVMLYVSCHDRIYVTIEINQVRKGSDDICVRHSSKAAEVKKAPNENFQIELVPQFVIQIFAFFSTLNYSPRVV